MMIYRKYSDRFLIISFTIIIVLPSLGLFMEQKADEIRTLLNREPYSLPPINIKRLGRTDFKGIENWFVDRALLLTSLSKVTSTAIYKMGSSIKPGQALLGKEDWLFLGNDYSASIDQYTGKNKPRPEEINQKLAAIKEMQDKATQNHIPFLVVLAPDKHEIYPEYLPDNIKKGSAKNRLELLEEAMLAHHIDFVSLKTMELKAKNTLGRQYGDLYLKGDSHWNYLGAYIAYQAIATHMEQKGIQINHIRFKFLPRTTTYSDLTNFLQLTHIQSNNPLPDVSKLTVELTGKDIQGNLSKIDYFAGSPGILNDPYEVINETLPNKQTCLLIGDSFSEALSIYFHNDCHTTIRIHPSNRTWNLSMLIQKYQPNIIVYEKVQRDLIMPITAF